MQTFIVRIILIVLVIIGIVYFLKKEKKYTLLINNIFWLIISWLICLILYYFSGIKYTIELDIYALLYILFVLALFILGQGLVKKISSREKKSEKKEEDFSKKINLFPLFIVALVSVIIYTIYILSINNINFGSTRDIETNKIATFFQILSSSSLIIWLYELAYAILNDKKITIWGVLSLIIFTGK